MKKTVYNLPKMVYNGPRDIYKELKNEIHSLSNS